MSPTRRVALASIVFAFATTACPSRSTTAPTPAASSRSPLPRGGTLVVAYPHEPATLNPYVGGGDAPATRDLVRPLLPSLYRIGPRGERSLSLLAAEPAVSHGPPFAVTLRLRSDARWSDGVAVTTKDLIFTWHAIASARNTVVSRDGYDQIAGIAAASDAEATITFKAPFARWHDLFWAVLPEHRLRSVPFATALAAAYPVSGGPFVLRSWTRGLEIVFERNPRAWGTEPALDRIVVRFVPDATTALQLLRRREVDALGPYHAVDLQRRASLVPGTALTTDRGATWAGLWLNVRSAELADVRVRRALAHSLDRLLVEAGIVRDEGEPLQSADPAPGRAAVPFAAYGQDLARARTLLDQAGWRGAGTRTRNGRELNVTVATVGLDEIPTRVLRALHAQAERVGIDLNVVDLDGAEVWRDWLRTPRFEAAFVVVRDPPLGSLRARFESTRRATSNLTATADAELDRLLRAADADGSAAAVSAEQRVATLVPVIPLYRVVVALTAGPAAGGLSANASADGFLWNAEGWFRRSA